MSCINDFTVHKGSPLGGQDVLADIKKHCLQQLDFVRNFSADFHKPGMNMFPPKIKKKKKINNETNNNRN